MKATMLVAGGLSGGLSSTIAGGKFIDGFKQGIITSGLNHLAHMGYESLEKYNKLEKFLNDNGISYKQQGKNATLEDLAKLKEIFNANEANPFYLP